MCVEVGEEKASACDITVHLIQARGQLPKVLSLLSPRVFGDQTQTATTFT